MLSVRILFVIGIVLLGGIVLSAQYGCATEQQTGDPGAGLAEGVDPGNEPSQVLSRGAELWGQNCMRCHNYRPPVSLSDRQWKIVMHHMRVRANLTADEHEQILRFLMAAN